jgi:hypothetical protein
MKKKLAICLSVSVIFFQLCISQNVSVNVITQNAGMVKKEGTVFFEVTINNTSAVQIVDAYKIKTQVSIADSSLEIQAGGHSLPTGWNILSNDGKTISLSNGKDLIAANDARSLLIAIKGKKTGGPFTLSGQLSISNGMAPGTAPGSLEGDNPADNFSTSSCTVTE